MGAIENVKEIADLIGEFHDIELNRRILKLEEEVTWLLGFQALGDPCN